MASSRRSLLRILWILLLPLLMGFEWQGRLDRLLRELQSAEPSRRREVVRILAEYPADRVGGALLGLLDDPDPMIRAEAMRAVGRLRLSEAVSRLVDWLDDPDADVRAGAALALGAVGELEAVPQLVRALGDSSEEVRREAISALSEIAVRFIEGSARARSAPASAATSSPSAGGGPGDEADPVLLGIVVPLLGRLDDDAVRVRIEAAQAVGRIGIASALGPLLARTADDAPEVRAAVYRALSEVSAQGSIAALVQGTRDDDAEARLAAIAALGSTGSERAFGALSALVGGSDRRAASASIAALASIRSERSTRILLDALAAPDLSSMAAASLRRLSGEGSIELPAGGTLQARLAALLANPPPSWENIAAPARLLAQLLALRPAPELVSPLLLALERDRRHHDLLLLCLARTGSEQVLVPLLERLEDERDAAFALAALEEAFERTPPDGRSADPLLGALSQIAPELRHRVVALLGRARAPRALPTLRGLLEHEDATMRLAAVQAIGALEAPEGGPVLLELIESPDASVRFEAADALPRAATPGTLEALLALLERREPTDRHAVLLALGGSLRRLHEAEAIDASLAARAIDALGLAAAADDLPLAARAIDALGRWGDPRGLETLTALLRAEPSSRRRYAARALGGLGPSAEGALRAAIADADPRVVAAATAALGEVASPRSLPALLAGLGRAEWPIRPAASFALLRMAQRGVLDAAEAEPLCALRDAPDATTRANGVLALAALGLGCSGGESPGQWLRSERSVAERIAAARWLGSRAAQDPTRREAISESLRRCVDDDLEDEVLRACRRPETPSIESSLEIDVYAYAANAQELLRDRPIALHLPDGSTLITYTDRNAHLRLRGTARGPLRIENPDPPQWQP